MCQQSLACFQYLSCAYADTDCVLRLLDICLAPYCNAVEEVSAGFPARRAGRHRGPKQSFWPAETLAASPAGALLVAREAN